MTCGHAARRPSTCTLNSALYTPCRAADATAGTQTALKGADNLMNGSCSGLHQPTTHPGSHPETSKSAALDRHPVNFFHTLPFTPETTPLMFTSQLTDAKDPVASAPAVTSKPSKALTYAQLLAHGRTYLEDSGMPPPQVRNLLAALRAWIRAHGYSFERIVGAEFGDDFERSFRYFCDVLADEVGERTRRDRQEQVYRWRRIVQALRDVDTLPSDFASALKHGVERSPLPLAQIARESGIHIHTFRSWLNKTCTPRGVLIEHLARLEELLELPQGSLSKRLPLARRVRYERNAPRQPRETSYTKLRRQQLAAVGQFAMGYTPQLQEQWNDLLQLKTDPMRDGARARNTWRVKPIEATAISIHPWMLIGGQVCATAGVHFGQFASYLGWLALPAPNGPGMPREQADTLAWLASPAHVIAYARWRIHHSGRRFHNGINVLCQLIESYLRPETGYLWLRPAIRETVPQLQLLEAPAEPQPATSEEAWHAHCVLARKAIRVFREKAVDTMGIRQSRDVTERIEGLLRSEFPLKDLVGFIKRLEQDAPPPAHERDYHTWIRDVALCWMLVSNPLRVSQFAVMTYRANGSGNLVRVGSGRYRLRFQPEDFKNEKGAASKPYDVEVDSTAAAWIERYLTETRMHLQDASETDRLFLPAVAGPRKPRAHLAASGLHPAKGWTAVGILTRMKYLTATYIESCPGFGPHAFRHIIATDYLRRHPGDYLTVATLLHDKLETVLKNYGHLSVDDGLRALSQGIREAITQLGQATARVSPATEE